MKPSFTGRVFALAGVSVLSSFPTLAQSPDNNIETITITGSHLPLNLSQLAASVSVLNEDEIRASGALQIGDLLRGLPGVSLSQSGSPGALTEIRVRGSESNHLLVLIDQVVANDIGQGSLIDLSHLTTNNVVRIELLRGPQSALWGSGAIGGVLSITTTAGTQGDAPSQVNGYVSGGNRGTYGAGISAQGQSGDVAMRAYSDYLTTDGDNVSRTGTEDDGYRNLTAGLSANWQISAANQLIASARVVDYRNDYDGTDYVTTGLPADANNVTKGKQTQLQLQWGYAPKESAYSSTLQAQYRRDRNDNTTDGYDAGGSTGERMQFTWINRYNLNSDWQLAGGAEYLQRLFEQRGPVSYDDPNQHQHDTTLSGFAELNGTIRQDWHPQFSVRFDDNSAFDNAASYRAGISWDVSSTYQLFTSIGKAVKTPTFTERFGYYPASFIGNAALVPESSLEAEAGIKANWSPAWSAQASVFKATLKDEILGFVYNADVMAYTADNASSDSERQGLDASLTYHYNSMRVSVNYGYLDATQDDSGDQRAELRRPKHRGDVSVAGDITANWHAYTKLSYTGAQMDTFYPPYPLPAETLELGGYALLTVSLSYDISRQWGLALRVDNALDKQYEDIVGYRGEARRARLTLSYQPK